MSESHSPADAPRALPERPDLEHLRGQAQTLLDALRASEPAAVDRMTRAMPHRAAPWRLADAQFAVAREYGFASWPKLVAHVQSLAERRGLHERAAKAFHDAVAGGDVTTLAALFQREPLARELVNAPIFPFGARPITRVKGNAALLDLLIANGADINLKSDWWAGPWGVLEAAEPDEAALYLSRGATIDIFAAANLDRVDLLTSMLDADPSLVHAKGGDGCRPLHFAKSAAAMDLLLSRGAEIDARDVDHESTALQWALPRPDHSANGGVRPTGSLDRVRRLADRGAMVDIFAAAALDDVALVRRAIEQYPSAISAHVNAPGYPPCSLASGGHVYTYTLGGGLSPYAVAAAFGSEAALAFLMTQASPKDRFIAACTTGRDKAAHALVRADPSLLTSLDAQQQAALPTAAWNANDAAVLLMLDLGFDPLAKGPEGGNVLHCAAWRGLADLVDRVLAHPRVAPMREAIMAAKDTSFGSTPLGWCCHGSTNCKNPAGDYPHVARSLLAAGSVVGPNLDNASPEVKAALGR